MPVTRRLTCLHGAESHSRWFDPFAREARASGIWSDVLAPDRNGWRGDVLSVADALLWVRQALALSSAQLTQSRNGIVERRPHDVVATSWGGLAALASLLVDNSAPWLSVGSLHLVAPGIFTSRGLLGRIARKALFDTLRGRGALAGKFDLAIRPADFVTSDALLSWVANDPARNQFVSARFLRTTAGLKKLVRERVGASLSIPVYLHLPESDPVINVGRTEEFLAPVVRQVFRYPSAVHALVLQHPDLLSRNIATVVA